MNRTIAAVRRGSNPRCASIPEISLSSVNRVRNPSRPLPVQAKRALIGQLLISAQMRRLRGSTNITGADGSPCGVIEEMMVVLQPCYLIEDAGATSLNAVLK